MPAARSSRTRSSIRAVVAVTTTWAPMPPSIPAVAKPIPEGLPAPVISAILPDRSNAGIMARG